MEAIEVCPVCGEGVPELGLQQHVNLCLDRMEDPRLLGESESSSDLLLVWPPSASDIERSIERSLGESSLDLSVNHNHRIRDYVADFEDIDRLNVQPFSRIPGAFGSNLPKNRSGGLLHIEILAVKNLKGKHLSKGSSIYATVKFQESNPVSKPVGVKKSSNGKYEAIICDNFDFDVDEYYGPLEVIITLKLSRLIGSDTDLGSVSLRLSTARDRSQQITNQLAKYFDDDESILGPKALQVNPNFVWTEEDEEEEKKLEQEHKHDIENSDFPFSDDDLNSVALPPPHPSVALKDVELNYEGGVWHDLFKKEGVRGQMCLCVNYFSFQHVQTDGPPINQRRSRRSRSSRLDDEKRNSISVDELKRKSKDQNVVQSPVWLHPLHVAAITGSSSLLTVILRKTKGWKLQSKPKLDGKRTALHLAALCGHADIVSHLQGAKYKASAQDTDGRTPVHYAIYGAQRGFKKPPNRNRGPHNRTKNRRRPLPPSGNQTVDILQLFTKRCIDKCDNVGCTPLISLCQRPTLQAVAIAENLIQSNSNINYQNKQGDTALSVATRLGNRKLMEYLINASDTLLSQANHNGRHPLFIAVEESNTKAVELLLSHGARPWASSVVDGQTPLHLAAQMGNASVLKMLLDSLPEDKLKQTILTADKRGLTCVEIASDADVEQTLRQALSQYKSDLADDNDLPFTEDDCYLYLKENGEPEQYDEKDIDINWNVLQQHHFHRPQTHSHDHKQLASPIGDNFDLKSQQDQEYKSDGREEKIAEPPNVESQLLAGPSTSTSSITITLNDTPPAHLEISVVSSSKQLDLNSQTAQEQKGENPDPN